MIDIDPHWLTGTTLLWTAVAVAYWFGALYLRVFDRHDHVWYIWGTFLSIGTAIFVLTNRSYIWDDDSLAAASVEYGSLAVIFVGGCVLFVLAREHAALREQYEKREDQLERCRALIAHYDIKTSDNDRDEY